MQGKNGKPKDDEGLKSQQVINICEYVIEACWDEIFAPDSADIRLTTDRIEKLKDILELSYQSHMTATSIILHGRKVNSALNEMNDEDFESYDSE